MTFSGAEATGGLTQALAVVLLAGILLVLVLKVGGRRIVAVLLTAVGIGVAVLGVVRQRPGGETVRTKMRLVSLADSYALTATPWPFVFALGGAVAVAGAALLWTGARHWPARPGRFDRGRQQAAPSPSDADDPAVLWRTLDAGLDPTAEPEDGDHPDASKPASRGHNGVRTRSPEPDPTPSGERDL